MEFTTKNAEETKEFGKRFSTDLINRWSPSDGATIVGLVGDLGAGKTTFVQGFAEGLRLEKRLVSPTFIILRKYDLEIQEYRSFYHIDLYRLEKNVRSEMKNLGLDDIFSDPKNIVLIEWADLAEGLLPQERMTIEIEHTSEKERKIKYEAFN